MSRDSKLSHQEALKRYWASIDQSFDLYLFNLLHFLRIAEYAKRDAAKKSAKLLPTEEDKQFTAKLGENSLVKALSENEELLRLFRQKKLPSRIDSDNVRAFYAEFSKTEEYREYLQKNGNNLEDHRQILLHLYKHCLNNETYVDVIEDNFPFWIDDKSLVVGAMKRSIKSLPDETTFFNDHRPTPETTKDFGEALLDMVCKRDQELLELIEPTLKNWDVERVAVIDMILLKMALCELVSFPTIPTKVTLNEFVEISKQYSTEKSKDFINGILDRLMKKLHKEGKIVKEGRGLVE